MFLSYAVEKFLDNFEVETGFNFLRFAEDHKHSYYFFDPGLNFDTRLRERLAKLKFADKQDDWIIVMYNRSQMSQLSVQSRQFPVVYKKISNATGHKYHSKFQSCQLDVVFFSNNPYYLESFEEVAVIKYDRSYMFEALYTIPVGDSSEVMNFKIWADNIEPSSFEKLSIDDRDSICFTRWSLKINFPVLISEGTGKLIKQITTKIKIVNNLDEPLVMQPPYDEFSVRSV